MTPASFFRSFLLVFTLWTFPWAVTWASLGIFSDFTQVFVCSFLSLMIYARCAKQLCLLSLKTIKTVNSPVVLKAKKSIRLIEVQSPKHAVYLFKGFPGERGIIAITTAELATTTEVQITRMFERAEASFSKPNVLFWTWVFPFHHFLTKSQEMLTGLITVRGLIHGLFWYAPFRVVRRMINKHRQEFPNVDSVI